MMDGIGEESLEIVGFSRVLDICEFVEKYRKLMYSGVV